MKQPSLADLHKYLTIEKLALDDEVINQPTLFYMVSEQLTLAMAERDAAKENLANVDASLYSKWRLKLSKIKNSRVTDAEVNNQVQCSQEHEEAFNQFLTAKTQAEKLIALKEAFQQRSYMLRDLVALYTANYFEDSSLKPTKAQEASQYKSNRIRVALAREAKKAGI